MKPEIAPTSPKKKNQPQVEEVWQSNVIQRPTRLPWGRVVFLMIVASVVIGIGLLVGAIWVQRYGPVGWWSKWLPVVTSTTVIQQAAPRTTSDAPKTVRIFAESLAGLAAARPTADSYGREDIQGTAVPLSDNGWMLTLQTPPATDAAATVVLRPDGDVGPVTKWLGDPASPMFFAKAGSTNEAPATFGDIAKSVDQSVWVIRPLLRDRQIFPRRLIGSGVPAWPSSDRLERTYQLDVPLVNVTGAVVVNQSGQLLGLVDRDGQVWPVSSIQSILKALIQTDQLERTGAGLRLRRRDEQIVPQLPTAAGWVVGAGTDQTAVEPKSAADRAGLKTGDIILKIDNQAVQNDPFETFQRWQPGETAVLTIERAGKERELTIQFSARRS